MSNIHKKKLLFLSKGILDSVKDNIHFKKQKLYSSDFDGDIIHVVFNDEIVGVEVDGFTIIGCYMPKWFKRNKFLCNSYFIFLTIKQVWISHKKRKYELIITREPIFAGVLGLALSKLLSIPVLVEMNGNYASGQLWTDKSFVSWLKEKYTRIIIPFVLKRADGIKLLYKGQLDSFDVKSKDNVWQFHNYIPMDDFSVSDIDDGYILAIGSPWKLKGFDLLVKAFKQVSIENSEVELYVITWFLNDDSRNEFLELIDNHPRIKLIPPVFYTEALKYISRCTFLVLPSRTEGMGRVMLEAMAHKKAVIGSNVDGIPAYLEHNKNGLLFESENIEELEKHVTLLVKDKVLRDRLAEEGLMRAKNLYSEKQFYLNYKKMIYSIIRD